MNQQLRQLAEQAHLYNDNDSFLTAALENFAQLIVKECDLYARRNWEHGTLLGGDLLNHFGVER